MSVHPSSFYPDLTDERLRAVASRLLDVRYDAFREICSELDDNYTRETVSFGRSRNMLIREAQSGEHSWLKLSHAGMDITFNIGCVPCRFFRDDAESPEKLGFFKRNAVDDLYADDDKTPVMWRFVIEKALTDEDEDRVLFAGYNLYQEKVAEWQYVQSAPTLHSIDEDVPASRPIGPAPLGLREDDDVGEAGDAAQGT
jgi:hypothetical protein